jgi:hypothetical protein
VEEVTSATRKLGLTYPIAIDNPADGFFGRRLPPSECMASRNAH